MTKLLIMGLPGSGKTTLAKKLADRLASLGYSVKQLNADQVRSTYNDWDFTEEGRIRQAQRMATLSLTSNFDFTVVDFIAPLPITREIFNADYIIWLDTIAEGRFADTNALFVGPDNYNIRITSKDADYWSSQIVNFLEMANCHTTEDPAVLQSQVNYYTTEDRVACPLP